MLTAKQHELIRFIQQRLEDTGISPSFEEMKEALDLKSKSGVHRLISALEERGFIRRLPNRARALEVVKLPENAVMGSPAPVAANDAISAAIPAKAVAPEPANDIIDVPLHGRIAAGAVSRPSNASTLPSDLRKCIIKAPPPMPELCGSTSVSTACAAIAASTALPPTRRISRPATEACRLAEEIMYCRAGSGVAMQPEVSTDSPKMTQTSATR